jgi:tetratricopeptide (TPR) repeat protein
MKLSLNKLNVLLILMILAVFISCFSLYNNRKEAACSVEKQRVTEERKVKPGIVPMRQAGRGNADYGNDYSVFWDPSFFDSQKSDTHVGLAININEDSYENAIYGDPNNYELYSEIANTLFDKGSSDEAIKILALGVENNPSDKRFYYVFGDLLSLKNKYEDALTQYNIALTIDPCDSSGYYKIADIYNKTMDRLMAKEYMSYYVSLTSDSGQCYQNENK